MPITSSAAAADLFPPRLRSVVKASLDTVTKKSGLFALADEYPSYIAAALSIIARDELARRVFKRSVPGVMFPRTYPTPWDNIIIGGGLHTAVLANNLTGTTLVISDVLGGLFARPGGPAYFLNSRNRPGEGGKPGRGEALNHMPGCPFQLSDINGTEYQTNDDFAFAILANLAMSDACYMDGQVNDILRTEDGNYNVYYEGAYVQAKRVFLATGSGEYSRIAGATDFSRFMRISTRILRKVKTAAVIGAGDSGKVVVEALLGIGPNSAPASVVFVERIDWWGQQSENYYDFIDANRVRYVQIAQSMPRLNCYSRIVPYFNRVERVVGKRVFAQGESRGGYDLIVNATGVTPLSLNRFWDGPNAFVYDERGKPIARKACGEEIYWVGPCAQLPASVKETVGIPENTIAAWRYTTKTVDLPRAIGIA